jgi:hypothetical protein
MNGLTEAYCRSATGTIAVPGHSRRGRRGDDRIPLFRGSIFPSCGGYGMTAGNVALVVVAEMISAFAGGFFGGFCAAILRVPALALVLLVPGALGAAILAGRWLRRRESAPARTDLWAGSILYMIGAAVVGVASSGYVGAIGALVMASAVAFALMRSSRGSG